MDEQTNPISDNQPPANPDDMSTQIIDMARIDTLLAEGEIRGLHGAMLWGSNYAALVTVEDDDLKATAVYKPQRGERPLWDFPDGTLCFRETLTYHVANALEWYLVPPTVLREGPHGLGSLQFFIDHDPETNYFTLDDRFADQLRQFAIFDYLVNNTDRKGGHLLLDARGKLWGIDHGLTFHTMPKLRTVIWEFAGQVIEARLLAPVHNMLEQVENCTSNLRTQLEARLTTAEVSAFIRRTQHLLKSGTYPRPGPGPNHPWPPI